MIYDLYSIFLVGNMNQANTAPVNNIGGGYSTNPNMNTCQTGPNNVHLMAGQMQHMSTRMGNNQQTMAQQQHANISMQSQNNQVNNLFFYYIIFISNYVFVIIFINFYLKKK